VGGKAGGGCGVEWAMKLREAQASAAAPSEGRDMDGDKMAASAHDEQSQNARPGAALLTGAMVIGFYLIAMTPARADTNASAMAPTQMSSKMSDQSPTVFAVTKDSDS